MTELGGGGVKGDKRAQRPVSVRIRDPAIRRKGGSGDGDVGVRMSPVGLSVLPRLADFYLGNWAANPG